MKIQPINPIVPNVKKCRNANHPAKPISYPNFKGNYASVYNSAMEQSIRHYNEAISIYRKLADAAKTEKGLFKGLYYRLLEGDVTEALKDAKNSSYYTGDLLTSTEHEYSLVSMNSGEISFNDPKYGSFGSKITFWLSNNGDLSVMRLKNYQKFYAYGCLKEYYDRVDGGLMNLTYYNRDGSKNFLKNLFLT